MTELTGACARSVAGPGVEVDAGSPRRWGPRRSRATTTRPSRCPASSPRSPGARRRGSTGTSSPASATPVSRPPASSPRGPVVGIAEAAMRTATYLGRSFSVVTTLGRTRGRAWDLAETYGVARACRGVHACEIPVLDLETSPDARERITQACREALAVDESDVIVLGCAGMADLCAHISGRSGCRWSTGWPRRRSPSGPRHARAAHQHGRRVCGAARRRRTPACSPTSTLDRRIESSPPS